MSKQRQIQSKDAISSGIAIIKQCPVCLSTLTEKMAVVLDKSHSSSLMHVTCENCAHSIVALIGNTPAGTGVIALVTDLSSEDVKRLRHRKEFSDNDLLDFYQTIQKNSRELLTKLTRSYELSTYRPKKRTRKR